MDSSTVILIVALVLSIVAGPALGFAWARRRLAARDRLRADRSARFADLDDSLRHLSSSGFDSPEPTGAPAASAAPDLRGAAPRTVRPPERPGTVGATPLVAPGAARIDTRGAAHPLASRRFDFEPPVFGDPPAARPPADHGTPMPQSAFVGDSAPPEPDATAIVIPETTSDPHDESAPHETPGTVTPTHDSPSFRPIADLVDEAITDRLSWLERLSTGRLLMLHQLGYDDPVKIANLRPAEVSRLARALQVNEDEILTEWIPAARKELGMRLATTGSESTPASGRATRP